MIYILDHQYSIDHKDFCAIIESEKTIEEIIEICVAVEFLFEELTNYSESLENNCLLKVFTKYFKVKNIKHLFTDEEFEYVNMPISNKYKKIVLECGEVGVTYAFLIDLYFARDSLCGPNYKEVMNKWLPKGRKLKELKKLLITEGIER